MPHLAIALLFGIRPLCNTGCTFVFHKDQVDVWYDGKITVVGPRNSSTDLWTLPIKQDTLLTPQTTPLTVGITNQETALFTHSIQTWMNAARFAHQSVGNPWISKLLKAVQRGFLKGCPNLSAKLILKCLNPSPATAKSNMKRPRHGIRSTTPKSSSSVTPCDLPPTDTIDTAPVQFAQPNITAGPPDEEEL